MKTIQIYFAYCEGREEEIAFALSESKARQNALESFWFEELGGEITVKPVDTPVHEVEGLLEYTGPRRYKSY